MFWARFLCRICATVGTTSYPIFEKGLTHNVEAKIKRCLSLNIFEEDFKPKVICHTCLTKLNDFVDFVELSHASNAKFEHILYNNERTPQVLTNETWPQPEENPVLNTNQEINRQENNSCVIINNACKNDCGDFLQMIDYKESSNVNYDQTAKQYKGNNVNILENQVYHNANPNENYGTSTVLRHSSQFNLNSNDYILGSSQYQVPILVGDVNVIDYDNLESEVLLQQQDGQLIKHNNSLVNSDSTNNLNNVNVNSNSNAVSVNSAGVNVNSISVNSRCKNVNVNNQKVNYSSQNYNFNNKSANGNIDNITVNRSNTRGNSKDVAKSKNDVFSSQNDLFNSKNDMKIIDKVVKPNNSNVSLMDRKNKVNLISVETIINIMKEGVENPSGNNDRIIGQDKRADSIILSDNNLSLIDPDSTFAPNISVLTDNSQQVNTGNVNLENFNLENVDLGNLSKISSNKNVLIDSKLSNNTKIDNKCEKKYSCSECKQSFTRKFNLTAHLSRHTNKKPYSCDVCGKAFILKSELSIHKRLHTDLYKCKFCSKSFAVPSKLERHIRTHTNLKPFVCNVENCGKAFSDKANLNGHLAVHMNERKFKCQSCEKRFKTKKQLIDHQKTHTSAMPFKCDICSKAYKWKTNLDTHMKKHNGYTCRRCFKDCGKLMKFLKHRRECQMRKR